MLPTTPAMKATAMESHLAPSWRAFLLISRLSETSPKMANTVMMTNSTAPNAPKPATIP